MSTTIAVLGGVGLFLLGMSVMTAGLKAIAGSALRGVLSKAAATPLLGSFWGAVVTMLVQSSSATTMTTIGLVSAGLLTFPQGLSLVFGANIGTTFTGWLVALIGVRVSLTSAALPIIFVGALIKLLTSGRVSGAGAAIAGFGLVLFGLTTLQQGMGGLADRLHPADLPVVLSGAGSSWWAGTVGVLTLVIAGLVMTALMQSSTAAVAVTMSAYFAGAIGLDHACALIIGQNVGTATSSALAAIGASGTAKRLALAYVLFKVIAAAIALVLFPFVIPLLVRSSQVVDGVTLLAAYHTAFNVIGVAVLLPITDRFIALVERILPERGSPLTRPLDPSALATPTVAVEAVRKTIAEVLKVVCGPIGPALLAGRDGERQNEKAAAAAAEASDALNRAQVFLSDVEGPPMSEEEQQRLTSTLHALDHASRVVETIAGGIDFGATVGGEQDRQAAQFCADAMQDAINIAERVAAGSPALAAKGRQENIEPAPSAVAASGTTNSAGGALGHLERCVQELSELQLRHRSVTLSAVADGSLTVDNAILRVDTVRNLRTLAYHAWRCCAHLLGHG